MASSMPPQKSRTHRHGSPVILRIESGRSEDDFTLPARTEGMTRETWEMLCFIEIHGGIARAKRILMGLESGPMNARNKYVQTRKNAARLTR